MIAAGNHEPGFRYFFSQAIESLNHELKSFIGSPFPECENPMYRSTAHREIRKFRTPGENSMRAQMDVVATIFIVQNLAISRHQD